MRNLIEGDLISKDIKIGIVASRFNDFITSKLISSATEVFAHHGGDRENITVVRVPGSFEIPLIAMKLATQGHYDAIVCLGCLIKGSTSHYELIARETTSGIKQINLQTGIPTILGIITASTIEQAIERAGLKHGNQGATAMLAAIEMANLVKQFNDS